MSNPEFGTIDWVKVQEIGLDGAAHGSLMVEGPGFRPLISYLTKPSYIHYDVKMKGLYVCDDRTLLYFRIRHSTDGIEADEGKTMVANL